MEDLVKASWPGWETVKMIGRGSFGTVYEIQRTLFKDTEKAALKVVSIPQHSGDVEEMYNDGYDDESITSAFKSHLESIVAEYSLMRKMNGSANIVNCEDVRYIPHEDGVGWDIFIKMELLTPLTKALPDKIDDRTAIKLAKDMCSALDLCKKFDIIHRDVKPQNIFVSPNGDYKLGDFGIAKVVEQTMGGTKIGTYKYMAPEVCNNQPYGAAADIYSLGLVLYWILNEHRLPFLPLPPAKISATIDKEANERRLRGDAFPAPRHGCPELKAIVMKACAYNVEDRYTSAAEMLADLNKLTKTPESGSVVGTTVLTGVETGSTGTTTTGSNTDTDTGTSGQTDTKDNDSDDKVPTGFAAFIKKVKERPVRFLVPCAIILCLIFGLSFAACRMLNPYESKYGKSIVRVYGKDYFDTSLKMADILKERLGVSKFEAVIIINSENAPDAISAACLAQTADAPILVTSEASVDLIANYVKNNLDKDGTVYIVGGTSAVPQRFDDLLSSFEVVRLSGQNRYETNLLALKTANSQSQELVVCSSDAFADGLIAASLNRPVMLVKDTLSDDQRSYLSKMGSNLKIYIIGGTSSISETLKVELFDYGTVIRINGTNRYETAVNVAQKFFNKPDYLFMIYNDSYADGFSAIPLIIHEKSPMLLIPQSGTEFAVEYATYNNIQYGMIISSEKFISDDVASEIFNVDKSVSIPVNP